MKIICCVALSFFAVAGSWCLHKNWLPEAWFALAAIVVVLLILIVEIKPKRQ